MRAAVTAANAHPTTAGGGDLIYLEVAGQYQLTQPQELAITGDTFLYGRGPATTAVLGNGTTRVFSVNSGVTAYFYRFAISGGRAAGSSGGNILANGSLFLHSMRVSGGSAAAGGGITLSGTGNAAIFNSLIDNNTAGGAGGGILDQLSSGATLSIYDSTIALNSVTGAGGSGGGISIPASTSVALNNATIGRNSVASGAGGGIAKSGVGGSISSYGALLAGNTVASGASNCSGTGYSEASAGSNREDAAGCGFSVAPSGSLGLSAALEDHGGDTPVLSIPSTSAAKRVVAFCASSADQRDAPRTIGGVCDAGAYEEGAVAPAVNSGSDFPDPGDPVVTPTPTPTATATPTPTPAPPVFQKSVGVAPISGAVKIRVPGGNGFTDLVAGATIPFGSIVDAKAGVVRVSSQAKKGGGVQTGDFSEGIFKLTQSAKTTDLTLTETLAPCPKSGKSAVAAKKPKKRHLWGDGSGSFRTEGKYSAATVRGTRWLVEDSCQGTLTQVKKGVVAVRDNVRHKTIIVRAGHRYLARP